jgi:hypothetical protein
MQPEQFPPGSAGIIADAVEHRARQARFYGRAPKPGRTSVFTDVAEEVRAFRAEMLAEMKKEIPAKFMHRALSQREARRRLEEMTPEERIARAKMMGPANFARMAMKLMGPKGAKPDA